jgi:hypothetical protein
MGRTPTSQTLDRVLHTLYAAQMHGRWSLPAMEQDAGVPRRTLEAALRDLALLDLPEHHLEPLGVFLRDEEALADPEVDENRVPVLPVDPDHDAAFDLAPDEVLVTDYAHPWLRTPPRITVPHALLLLDRLAAVAEIGDEELTEGARTLSEKIRAGVVRTAGAPAQRMLWAVEVPDDEPDHDPNVVTTLRRAIDLYRVTVTTWDDGATRELDPVDVVAHDGRTYLWAHEPGTDRFVAVAVARIEQLEVTAEPSRRPARIPPFDRYAGIGADFAIRVRLSADAAWVPRYYRCRDVEHHDDGTVSVTLDAPSKEWAIRFVRRMGVRALGATFADLNPPNA